jgi:plasmid stability protein
MDPFVPGRSSMPNLSIKDVPESIAAALRQRAARHHRSLQGELMAIVERAAAEEANALPAAGWAAPATSGGAASPPSAAAPGKTLEQIAREHRARRPRPAPADGSAGARVRADRDRRAGVAPRRSAA